MNARGVALSGIFVIVLAACGGHGSVPPSAAPQPSERHTQVWQSGNSDVTEQFGLPGNTYATSPIDGSNGTVYFIGYNYGTGQLALANIGYRGAVHVFAPPSPQPSLQPQLAAYGSTIYAADSANNVIYAINEKTGVFTALPISGVSSPSSPVYKGGFLYFYNQTASGAVLDKVSLKYLTTKQFPAPASGFAGTVGPDGNIYYIESGGSGLIQFNVQTHAFQVFPASSDDCLGDNDNQSTNASYFGAQPIVSFNGALYVTYESVPCGATGLGGVFSVTTSGAYSDVPLNLVPGQGLALSKDGNLYATTASVYAGSGSIWRIPPSPGAPVAIENADTNITNAPFAVGGDGNLWFLLEGYSGGNWVSSGAYVYVLRSLSVSPQRLSLSLTSTPSGTLSVTENESGGTITAKSSNVGVVTVSGTAPTFTVNAAGAGYATIAIQDAKHNFVDVPVYVSP